MEESGKTETVNTQKDTIQSVILTEKDTKNQIPECSQLEMGMMVCATRRFPVMQFASSLPVLASLKLMKNKKIITK